MYFSLGGCDGYLDPRRWNRRSQRRRLSHSVDKRSDRRHADLQVSLESPAGAKRDAVLRSRYCQMGVCIRRAVSRNLAASRRSDFATTTNRCALSVWRTHDADGTSPSLTSTQCRRHPGNRGARHLSWQEGTDPRPSPKSCFKARIEDPRLQQIKGMAGTGSNGD